MEDLVYIYINIKLLWKWPSISPMTWYEKNVLFKDSMFDVDENVDASDSSGKDPII